MTLKNAGISSTTSDFSRRTIERRPRAACRLSHDHMTSRKPATT